MSVFLSSFLPVVFGHYAQDNWREPEVFDYGSRDPVMLGDEYAQENWRSSEGQLGGTYGFSQQPQSAVRLAGASGCSVYPTGQTSDHVYGCGSHYSSCLAGGCPTPGSWLLRVEPCGTNYDHLNPYWHGAHMTISHHVSYGSHWTSSRDGLKKAKNVFSSLKSDGFGTWNGHFNPKPSDFKLESETHCHGGSKHRCQYVLRHGYPHDVLNMLGQDAQSFFQNEGLQPSLVKTHDFHITINSDTHCSMALFESEIFKNRQSIDWTLTLFHVQHEKGVYGGQKVSLVEKHPIS